MSSTAEEVARVLHEDTGFVGYQCVVMTAVCRAESGRNPLAVNINWSPGTVTHLSFDAGWFQLNSYWLPKVLHVLLPVDQYGPLIFDPVQNARWAYTMWKAAFDTASGGWSAKAVAAYQVWITYRHGLHLPWMAEAKAAALAVGVPL